MFGHRDLDDPLVRWSTVPWEARRMTRTGRFWPMRWQRSIACRSAAGLKSESWMMTVSAEVRLMPRPPARVVTSSTGMSVPLSLYSSIMYCRSPTSV